jgi:hypothetical protein
MTRLANSFLFFVSEKLFFFKKTENRFFLVNFLGSAFGLVLSVCPALSTSL